MARSSAAPANRDVPSFDVVDALTPVGTAPCAECRGPIVDTYYEADRGVICASCHTRLAAAPSSDDNAGRFGRAFAFGTLGALAAAAGYVALLATTGRDLTVFVLLVGLVVGKAVRTGSGARGGRRFQWLAVALTYLAIATTYVPFVVKGYSRVSARPAAVAPDAESTVNLAGSFLSVSTPVEPEQPSRSSLGSAALGFAALLLLAVAAPVLEGATHLAATLITLVALAQAWRMNRRVDLRLAGPYRVRPPNA
ncbi:MAG TPA: hypothetical protein VM076_08775 [Gemmatimonadaceae bacterium]|nr:hypothetical protein [Gemmatimonadaceae bacterium]